MNDRPEIKYELVEALGEPLLRLVVAQGEQRVYAETVDLNDQDACIRLSEKVARAAAMTLTDVEQHIAQITTQARESWNRDRNKPRQLDGFQGELTTLAALEAKDLRHVWLIKDLLVRDQPALLGGPKKSLKTSAILDAALSLASGKRFLGRFDVPERKRVAVLSGESGEMTICETALRIAKAKGVRASDCANLMLGFQLPRLTSDEDLTALRSMLCNESIDVVFIDPAYLCMLSGGGDLQASNMFHIGPLLLRVTRVCQEVGSTLVLVHHAGKASGMAKAMTGDPLELEDLAYAGFQEFARQWILINRREKFEPGSGMHRLWLNVGGSAGHSGLWGVDIDEGVQREDFGGRRWDVHVRTMDEALKLSARNAERKKNEAGEARAMEARKKIITALESYPEGETMSTIAQAAGLQTRQVGPVLALLLKEEVLDKVTLEKPAGRSTRSYDGWRLKSAVNQTLDNVASMMEIFKRERKTNALAREWSSGTDDVQQQSDAAKTDVEATKDVV